MQPFVPTIETSGSNNMFLDDCPIAKLQAGKFHRVPVMMGYNKNEATIFSFGKHTAWLCSANMRFVFSYLPLSRFCFQ